MDQPEEQTISSRTLFTGRLLKVRRDTVRLPNGVETTREVVEHPGAVAVIALTGANELVLVRQYRRPAGRALLEVPAGVPRPGEDWAAAARRELAEETGYRAGSVEKLWAGYASPGYSNEVISFFVARGLTAGPARTDEDELIEVVRLPLDECRRRLAAGEIDDNKTMIAIMAAELYLKR
ncbi:MAG: NUDIX hydrolase [Candidatus Saganbacteria bacterium]|nr:NUDIX hydrolase [Candidatus Saganbacteria bacterium]